MTWQTITRPGYAGKKRDKLIEIYNNTYGPENWRIAWQLGDQLLDKALAYQIYEDGYYHDSFNREDLWKELISKAGDVYDIEVADVESGLDYFIQNGPATHLQDISIRRVVLRRGWQFQGTELIQIRGHKSYWGKQLSPGKVPFHRPEMIILPRFDKYWWNDNSIEEWYQLAKVLQIRE